MRELVLDLHDRRQDAVSAVGLSFVRIKALRRLATGPSTMRELAAYLGVDAPYVTVISRDLEERGFVTRSVHPTDGRAKLLTITPAGRDVNDRAGGVLNAPPAALAALPADELERLADVLARLAAPTPPPEP
jgi:DNA-binding MarR family transcriptional regulator